jgi:thiol-disulfide isomerase/thioredoxin
LAVCASANILSSRSHAHDDGVPDAAGAPDETVTAPELPAGLPWLQGGPLRFRDLRGRVVVVHFWTNGCINCIRNYPVYRSWQEQYDAKKLTIVGIHTPEFAAEGATERVKKAARDNALRFPIVLDPDAKAWKAWDNHYWPAIYLVDKKGHVRARWEGELHLDTAEGKRFAARIDELLKEEP